MYIGLGIVLIVIGAILAFALNIDIPGVGDDTLGYILMAAGVVAIILSFAMTRRRPVGYTTTRGRPRATAPTPDAVAAPMPNGPPCKGWAVRHLGARGSEGRLGQVHDERVGGLGDGALGRQAGQDLAGVELRG